MAVTTHRDRSRVARDLASRQHHVISRSQLNELGFSNHAIAHRIRRGRLSRLHPRVYAVGRADLTREGRWMAGLLWAGPTSGLSYSSSAAFWDIGEEWAVTELSIPGGRRLSTPGIRVHRTLTLASDDVVLLAGFRTTTVVRTLIDLAGRHSTKRLESAVNAAVRRRLIGLDELREAVASRSGLRGLPHLRRLLDARTFRLTDSQLEQLFLPLADAAGLPVPETRVMLNGFRVDFFWPDLGLVVEADSMSYHWTKAQQQRDRLRDHAHWEAGLRPLRFTHEQIVNEPVSVIRTLSRVAGQLRDLREAVDALLPRP